MLQAPPRLEYEANVVSPIEHEMPSPRMVAPVDTMIHEPWKKKSNKEILGSKNLRKKGYN